jgi:hypothetical protein
MKDTAFISRYQKLEQLLTLHQVNEHMYSTELMDKQRIFDDERV